MYVADTRDSSKIKYHCCTLHAYSKSLRRFSLFFFFFFFLLSKALLDNALTLSAGHMGGERERDRQTHRQTETDGEGGREERWEGGREGEREGGICLFVGC